MQLIFERIVHSMQAAGFVLGQKSSGRSFSVVGCQKKVNGKICLTPIFPMSVVSSNLKPVSGKTTVVVHPLVLLSVVDHYKRAACKDTRRAVGVLLGSWKKGNILDVATSYAGLPFCFCLCECSHGAHTCSAFRRGRERPQRVVFGPRLSADFV